MEIISMNENYVCTHCGILFQNEAEHKLHYKTDFHRYNIKRRLIDLPPASVDQFNQQFGNKAKTDSASSTIALLKCIPCNKSFQSKNTFDQHIKSKKHKDQVVIYDLEQKIQEEQGEQVKSEVSSRIYETTLDDLSICLFCSTKCPSYETNLNHMKQRHGFFFAEEKYLTDGKGLLKYLAQKVNQGLMCIECENKGTKDKKTPEAVRQHMIDKSHCFMSTDQFEEYMDFYDYTLVVEPENNAPQTQELLESKEIIIQDSDDSEWELVDEEDQDKEIESEEKQSEQTVTNEVKETVTLTPEEITREEKQKLFIELRRARIRQVVKQGYLNPLGELQLPNGKLLGHRKYKVFYNQYYRQLGDHEGRMKMLLGEQAYEERAIMIQKKQELQIQQKCVESEERKQYYRLNAKTLLKFKRVRDITGIRNNNQLHYREQNPL